MLTLMHTGPILAPAGQSDLQVMGLMSIYLQSTSTPHASWLVVGIALRAAQDIGLHRERVSYDSRDYGCSVFMFRIADLPCGQCL